MSLDIYHYVNSGSRVFCTFLDASKAFDRLVHSGLFLKLMERKVPLIFLDIIISWYRELSCRVKWGDSFSNWFSVTAGVRQGGILSPDLYCIYVDELHTKQKKSTKDVTTLIVLQRHSFTQTTCASSHRLSKV